MISKSISRALNYNEQKVQKNKAECIYAGNFLKDRKELSFNQKLLRFTRLIERNDRAKTNSLHISLNFDASEKFTPTKFKQIASAYIQKIGFGNQPYLVYQHYDAGHPHMHIVTTNIQSDGTRINTHNIGRNQSETARKEIEKEFNLIRASARELEKANSIVAVVPQKVTYGKSETKRAITNVLDSVINRYHYTSLAELNAVLRQYNVLADRGSEKGVMYEKGGLLYRVLDKEGNKIGVPIKASSIYSRPTLQNIGNRFADNEEARKPYKADLVKKVGEVLLQSKSMEGFTKALQLLNIATVLRRNEKGFLYGITFVDHHSKSVFNGSDLGKALSAAGLQQFFNQQPTASDVQQKEVVSKSGSVLSPAKEQEQIEHKEKGMSGTGAAAEFLDAMAKAEDTRQYVPYELRKKKRKKRRKKFGL